MNRHLFVSDFGMKVIMLQVSPGAEKSIAKKFAVELKKINRKYCIFKALGNYDLFIIYESFDFSPDVIDIGTIPGILKSNELLCFPWTIKGNKAKKASNNEIFTKLTKKILGLSFLKINPNVILHAGSKVEHSLTEFYKNKENLSILGNFGWNEILFFVHGDSIKDTYKALLEFADLTITYEHQGKHITDTLFLKTLSFLGLTFDMFEKLERDPSFLKSELPENFSKKCFPHLYITCCPQHMSAISADATRSFGKTHIVIGAEDLGILKINKMNTWGEFLSEVFAFRKRNIGSLYSTSVRILREEKITSESPSASKSGGVPLFIDISGAEAELIKKKYGSTFQSWFLNTLYAFNNLMQNHIVRDAFIDMRPLAQEIKAIALSSDAVNTEVIGMYIEHFIFGAQQRALSTHSGIDNIEYRFSAFKGGIQRVLQAIELIPKSMIENIGFEWNGIVNAGEYSTYRSDMQVLNIPIECLFRPKRWWGLFHEIGHFVALQHKFLEFEERGDLKDFMDRVMGISENHADFHDFGDLCWEIVADIFDFKFGFIADINTYFSALWNYLLTDYYVKTTVSQSEKNKHLFRSFYVYLYNKLFIEKENVESLDKNLREEMAKFLDLLKQQVPQHSGDLFLDETINKIIDSSLTFLPLLQYIGKKYESLKQKTRANDSEIDSIINTLKRGQVYWEEIRNPEMIVYRLKKEGIYDFKVNMATILSFWNSFQLRYVGKHYKRM